MCAAGRPRRISPPMMALAMLPPPMKAIRVVEGIVGAVVVI
jgi:hypothetical protein